mmetsp:Transcript_152527/g.292074  ORF Transcript_152527/g.292074 Transcript_152527/m.292074 type:complete len:235 (+) Transcript_152527:1-705(+)
MKSLLLTTVVLILSISLGSHWTTSSATGMVFDNIDSVAMDGMVPAYAILFLLYSRALVLDIQINTTSNKNGLLKSLITANGNDAEASLMQPRRKLWWAVVLESLFLVYGFIILGLADDGPPKPFANIRTHGGSNHYLMPTGLLQEIGEDHPSWFGRLYAAGVVRVDHTTSEHINSYFPGEITDVLMPQARELCQIAGHNGREFSPAIARLAGTALVTPKVPGPNFIRYTVPAFE